MNTTKTKSTRSARSLIYWVTGISGCLLLFLSPGLNAENPLYDLMTFFTMRVGTVCLSIYGAGIKEQSNWPFMFIFMIGLIMLCYLLSIRKPEPSILLVCTYVAILASIATSTYALFGDFPDGWRKVKNLSQ